MVVAGVHWPVEALCAKQNVPSGQSSTPSKGTQAPEPESDPAPVAVVVDAESESEAVLDDWDAEVVAVAVVVEAELALVSVPPSSPQATSRPSSNDATRTFRDMAPG